MGPHPQERPTAVPKRKMSRSNTRHRRAQWKATTPQLATVTIEGTAHQVPQRLVKTYERGPIRPEG
ncbi:50S ribosomal protein L32 [Streptomyces sp. CB00316]|uniref:50S ribosomal protein L32 n=1 Tax=Streptomyces sp. CB00316 TaxID=1703932 RepID=UPI00227746FC|nr:50S ribosomal protein L32 [Streptomyces sp. CB00316]